MYDAEPYPTVRLEELVEVLDDLRAPVNGEERTRRIGTVPYYGANGQQGWIDKPLTNEPLILLAEDGGNFDSFAERPIAYRIEGPAWVNNHAHIIRAKPGVSQSFVFWSIVHKDIRQFIAGGTRAKLTQGELRRIEIRAPDEPQRAKIAQVLDTLDTTIRQTEAIIEKLKQVKQGLLHDLLTRGIDVNGELRPPQSQAPHLYKHSPLGWIPRAWEISTVRQLAELLVGPAFESHRFVMGAEGVRLLRGINVSRGFIRWDEGITARWRQDDPFVDRYRLRIGDVVIGMDGALVGRNVATVTPDDVPSILVQRVARIRPAGELGDWIRMNIQSDRFLHHIDGVKTHTAIPHITGGDIANFVIPLPPDEEVARATKGMQALARRISAEQSLSGKLRATKAGLMDDLLTGRVRVTCLIDEVDDG